MLKLVQQGEQARRPPGSMGVVEGVRVTVASRIPSRIVSMHKAEGDTVRAGEVLAELDLLDSKMYEMFDALSGVSVGAFSERQWALDNRQLYCHGHGHLKKGESK